MISQDNDLKNLTFEDAFALMRQGYGIAREYWSSGKCFKLSRNGNSIVRAHTSESLNGFEGTAEFCNSDIFAEDWYAIKL